MEATLELFVRKIAQQIENETALVLNFKQDFKWLKKRLTMLRATLKFADENHKYDDDVKQWIEDVRDTLWDTEDILDQYSLEEDILRVGDPVSSARLLFFHYKMGRKIRKIKEHYKMGRKIKEIKERMKLIMETANEMRLIRDVSSIETETSASTVRGQWKTSSIMESSSFPVAVDIKIEEIICLLEDPAVQVLAVVGMGGIGKTFLLQHVYNKVKHTFEDSIWLSISQTYSVEQLQRDLAHRLQLHNPATSGISWTLAAEDIHDRLKERKCLIVLDDVWRATEEDDLLRRLGIPIAVDNNLCKVIVTSRNKEVFSYLNPSTYPMPLLSGEDSWKLFCAHAFPSSHEILQPTPLEMIAREIEKECGRLPLAIKTVASSLAKATTSREWESKLHQLKEVGAVNHHDPILQILKLSYYWLPSFLKPCFVYLSFFPEDQDINCQYLVNLWIAEGFIPQTEDQVDMAWDYLRLLANLCLVDVWEHAEFLDKYCRVHDLVLDLAVHINKENKAAFSVEETSRKGKVKQSGCHRILLAKKGIDNTVIAKGNLWCAQVVRTLSLSQNSTLNNIPPHMLSNARVLRVLDLSNTGFSTLPESIGDLKLLRLLNLSRSKLKELPQSMRKLKSLSFLDVSWCSYLFRLPLWIGELVSLQHLNILQSAPTPSRIFIPKGVSKLMSLSTLRSGPLALSIEDDEYLRLEDVGNMTCLQELRVKLRNEAEIRSLAQGVLGRLVNLRTLDLRCAIQRLARIPLPETIKVMKDIQKLKLKGLFAVPGWIRGFQNLKVLQLFSCDCSELYPALETMGNLTALTLQGDENCREFPKAFGKPAGFPNLRVFRIWVFEALEELPEMEEGAMASLETLDVQNCPRLTNVPPGLQGLKKLREFRFVESGTDEYRSRLKEEWSTVQANNQHLTVDIP